MKLLKNKKGSILVEKILMTAFAVAAGGAVVVYGTNVINNSKNTEITGILSGGGGQLTQEEINEIFDDSTHTITLDASRISGSTLPNLLNYVQSLNWDDNINSSFSYKGNLLTPNNNMSDESGEISWTMANWNSGDDIIHFIYESNQWVNEYAGFELQVGCFYFGTGNNEYTTTHAESDLVWKINDNHYSAIKNALISDLR